MSQEREKDFAGCLRDALQAFPEHSFLRRLAALFEDDGELRGKLVEWITTPKGRAFLRHQINSEQGRDWLWIVADGESPELGQGEVTESDLLRWAFIAELICFGFSSAKAASYVDQGLTLRDFNSKSVEELAERRWSLVAQSENWVALSKNWADDDTPAELVADIIQDGIEDRVAPAEPVEDSIQDGIEDKFVLKEFLLDQWHIEVIVRSLRVKRAELGTDASEFEFFGRKIALSELEASPISLFAEHLASEIIQEGDPRRSVPGEYQGDLIFAAMSLEPAWVETKTKDWLRDQFQQYKHEVASAELQALRLADQEIGALLDLGLSLDEIKLRSAKELTDLLYSGDLTEDGVSLLSYSEMCSMIGRRIGSMIRDGKEITLVGALQEAVLSVIPIQANEYRRIPFGTAIVRAFERKEVTNTLEKFGHELHQIEKFKINQAIRFVLKTGLIFEFRRLKGEIERVEKARNGPFRVRFYDILVLSDFHMAAGDQPSPEGITRISPTEDFYYDDTFFRFVHSCEVERRTRKGHVYELIFNGDFIDFAQVVVPKVQNRKPLIPWPLPSLLDEAKNTTASARQNASLRESGLLAERLLRILYDVYGAKDLDEAIANQIRVLDPAGESNRGRFLAGLLERSKKAALGELSGRYWDETTDLQEWTGFAKDPWNEELKYASEEELNESLLEDVDWETTETWAQPYWNELADAERQTRDMTRLSVLAMERGEALDQLADAYRGHRSLFQGLAWFLAQGNQMIVLRGNHDPQWYWPEVQLAFVGWLKSAYTDLIASAHDPATQELPVPGDELRKWLPTMSLEDFETRVDFDHSWYYHRDRLVYIEHGGQQEAVDSHRYFLMPAYTNEEVAGGSRNGFIWPVDVSQKETANVLAFLNQAKSAREIDIAIEIPFEPDVGIKSSQNIIDERNKLGSFTSLEQVDEVLQVGRERFTEIIKSLRHIPSRNLTPGKAQEWLPALEVSPNEKEIEPPIGSLGNIYFINNIEIQFPNIDRPGYESGYLDYLKYGNPKIAWYFLKAFGKMVVAMTKWAVLPLLNWRKWVVKKRPKLRSLFSGFTKWRGEQHERRLADYARLTGFPKECAEELDRTKWVKRWRMPAFSQVFVLVQGVLFTVPFIVLAVALYKSFGDDLGIVIPFFNQLLLWSEVPQSLLKKIGVDLAQDIQPLWYRIVTPLLLGYLAYWGVRILRNLVGLGEDFLYKPSQRVAQILAKYDRSAPYLLFGHDHVRNAQRLKSGPWYLNTGAWMHKFGKDIKRLLREPLEFSFVRMIDTHRVLASNSDDYMVPSEDTRPIVDLLRWNDEGGWVEACETFEGLDEANAP